jgi:Flp pilus assembly pilin Flp
VRSCRKRLPGQGLVEVALVLALVSVASVAVLSSTGVNIRDGVYGQVNQALAGVGGATATATTVPPSLIINNQPPIYVGDFIHASWVNVQGLTETAWVGLFKEDGTEVVRESNVDVSPAGSTFWMLSATEPGNYEVRIYASDTSTTPVITSSIFTIIDY